MTTARDICTAALEDIGVLGVGQTPLAEDLNGALVRLNRMIGQWQRRRWLCYELIDGVCTSTSSVSYTVGSGGNFNIARPDRIESAFARQIVSSSPNQIDYPLGIIPAKETYNLIALKQLQSWPQYVFYDPAFPLGNLFIYPVPQAGQFELHISVKVALQQPANLSTVFSMPQEYEEAMEYNLAGRLCAKYQIDVPPVVATLAQAALDLIRSANTQIPLMELPEELTGGGNYNIYSDGYT